MKNKWELDNTILNENWYSVEHVVFYGQSIWSCQIKIQFKIENVLKLYISSSNKQSRFNNRNN
jgi:hypothetical protein